MAVAGLIAEIWGAGLTGTATGAELPPGPVTITWAEQDCATKAAGIVTVICVGVMLLGVSVVTDPGVHPNCTCEPGPNPEPVMINVLLLSPAEKLVMLRVLTATAGAMGRANVAEDTPSEVTAVRLALPDCAIRSAGTETESGLAVPDVVNARPFQ